MGVTFILFSFFFRAFRTPLKTPPYLQMAESITYSFLEWEKRPLLD